MLNWSHVTWLTKNLRQVSDLDVSPDWSHWTELELVRRLLQLQDAESALRSLWGSWDLSWCCARRAGSQSWVCDKTKVAGSIGNIVVQSRQADSEAGGFGAAEAGWSGPFRYWCPSTVPMNSMKNSFKSSRKSLYSPGYFSLYSSWMNSNMISPMQKGQNSWYLAWFHENFWNLVYQEVSCRKIHIRIHILIHGNSWIHIQNSYMNSCTWIHEKTYDFWCTKKCPVKKLYSHMWIHVWIQIWKQILWIHMWWTAGSCELLLLPVGEWAWIAEIAAAGLLQRWLGWADQEARASWSAQEAWSMACLTGSSQG